MNTKSINTVVIGGGQAGLAVGYYLMKYGRDFVILDANQRIGEAWRTRWDSLRLFTPASFNCLPGMLFPGQRNYFPSKDEMADYLESYVARFNLPVWLKIKADTLTRSGNHYLITAGRHQLQARNVVVATGANTIPSIPKFADQLDPAINQLHSADYRNPRQIDDGAVLVVGAGNSGAEIAMDLASTHHIWLAGRDVGHIPVLGGFVYQLMKRLDVYTWPGRMLATKGASGGDPLGRVHPKELAEAGVHRVLRVVGVSNGLPMLEDGRVLHVENVVWCTGFVRSYPWIRLPVFSASGEPLHYRGVVQKEPGLYFIGLPFQSSLASHLVGGVGKDAKFIVKQIVKQSTNDHKRVGFNLPYRR